MLDGTARSLAGSREAEAVRAVAPFAEWKAVARRLMRAMEDRLDAPGCPKVNLQVRSANTAAVGFTRAIGYEVEDHVSMGKWLGGDGPAYE